MSKSLLASSGLLILVTGVFLYLYPHARHNDQLRRGLEAAKIGDWKSALEQLLPLAEAKDPVAEGWIGHLYAMGFGVVQDREKAIYWFRREAAHSEGNSGCTQEEGFAKEANHISERLRQINPAESTEWQKIAIQSGYREGPCSGVGRVARYLH